MSAFILTLSSLLIDVDGKLEAANVRTSREVDRP
jgi:hypothetical protein